MPVDCSSKQKKKRLTLKKKENCIYRGQGENIIKEKSRERYLRKGFKKEGHNLMGWRPKLNSRPKQHFKKRTWGSKPESVWCCFPSRIQSCVTFLQQPLPYQRRSLNHGCWRASFAEIRSAGSYLSMRERRSMASGVSSGRTCPRRFAGHFGKTSR